MKTHNDHLYILEEKMFLFPVVSCRVVRGSWKVLYNTYLLIGPLTSLDINHWITSQLQAKKIQK